MNHDAMKNIIHTDGTFGSITKGSGQLFIKQLQEDAQMHRAPAALKKDWEIIEDYFSCKNGVIDAAANEKIALAWQSYLALGVSPSHVLDKPFSAFKAQAIKEKWQTIDVPEDVRSVFDRLLATDSEIAQRKTKNKEFPIIAFVKKKITEVSDDLGLSKKEAKAWKIIILGCFAGFMLKYSTTTAYGSISEWLHPYEEQRFGAFMWTLMGGVVTFFVLYAIRLLNNNSK